MEIISRDEAIEAIENICNTPCNQYFINAVKKLPTIEERKEGRWIDQGENLHKCSNCGQIIFSQTVYDLKEFHAFCGRCGAKMKGE